MPFFLSKKSSLSLCRNPEMKLFMLFFLLFYIVAPFPCLSGEDLQLLEDAEHGDCEAQYTLAHLYLKGRGSLVQDVVAAVNWFEKAAALHHRDAAFDLAILYLEGLFVAKDLDKARYWLEEAADNGHAEAQYLSGRVYRRIDEQKSIFRLKQAAALHHEKATAELWELCRDNQLKCK